MECKENYQLLKKKLQSELLEALETGGEWSDEVIMGEIYFSCNVLSIRIVIVDALFSFGVITNSLRM